MSSSTRPVPATVPPAPSSDRPAAATPAPTRRRRSPALVGLGVALIALGGIGGGWLGTRGHDTHPITIAATAMPAGHTITATDLRTVQVAGDIPFASTADAAQLLGRVTTGSVDAGTVMADSMAAGPPGISKGQAIVGVPLKAGQYPALGLHSGDNVALVRGVAAQGANTANTAPTAWTGRVITVTEPNEDGVRVVDVALEAGQAPAAAAATTSGTVVLVLTGRGQS